MGQNCPRSTSSPEAPTRMCRMTYGKTCNCWLHGSHLFELCCHLPTRHPFLRDCREARHLEKLSGSRLQMCLLGIVLRACTCSQRRSGWDRPCKLAVTNVSAICTYVTPAKYCLLDQIHICFIFAGGLDYEFEFLGLCDHVTNDDMLTSVRLTCLEQFFLVAAVPFPKHASAEGHP